MAIGQGNASYQIIRVCLTNVNGYVDKHWIPRGVILGRVIRVRWVSCRRSHGQLCHAQVVNYENSSVYGSLDRVGLLGHSVPVLVPCAYWPECYLSYNVFLTEGRSCQLGVRFGATGVLRAELHSAC